MILDWLRHINFEYPLALLLLLGIPFLWIYYKRQHKSEAKASLSISTVSSIPKMNRALIFPRLLLGLRMLCLACLIVAMSNPREKYQEQKTNGEGIDIMLCFDISGSMTEQDFTPNRIEAAKTVATRFVTERPGDRIGITIFSSLSFTLCPLTADHATVLQQIMNIQPGYLKDDGTAIGAGLATSVDRLRTSKAKSKICILLTDGVDFGGQISPDVATQMAQAYHIKVYTIGIGSNKEMDVTGDSPNGPQPERRKMDFNADLLKTIAQKTGGDYFQAANNFSLTKVYDKINQLEKSQIEVTTYNRYNELYRPWLILGLAFLLLEVIIRYLIYRKFP